MRIWINTLSFSEIFHLIYNVNISKYFKSLWRNSANLFLLSVYQKHSLKSA